MIQRVKELYESGKVDLPYYNIVKEAVQMEPGLDLRVLTSRPTDFQMEAVKWE